MVGSQNIDSAGINKSKKKARAEINIQDRKSAMKVGSGLTQGRESAFTLLAESVAEKQRISHFRGLSPEN